MVAVLSGQKTQAQVIADREAKKADTGVKEELVDGSGNPVLSGNGQAVQTAQAPAAPSAASTLSPEQLEYNRLRAQLDSLDALRDTGGSQNVFVSRDPALDAKEAQFRDALAKMAASLKAKGIDAAAEYDAPEPGTPAAAPVDLAKKYVDENTRMRNLLQVVKEAELNQPPQADPTGPNYSNPNWERYQELMGKYDFLEKEATGAGNLVPVNVMVSTETRTEIDKLKAAAEKLAGPNLQAWEQARQKEHADLVAGGTPHAELAKKYLEDVGMSRFLSIMNEGRGPLNRATTAEAITMKHYTAPVLNVAKNATPSMIGKYFKAVEEELNEAAEHGKDRSRQLAERVSTKINELSNDTLASYKKKSGADASKADKEGDFKRGDKRFSGIVKATKKEFDNDAKKHAVSEDLEELLDLRNQVEEAIKQRLDPKCWTGKHKEGTKIKGGVRVNNCVPNESIEESKDRCQQCGMKGCTCAPGKCKCKPVAGWIPNKGFKKAVDEAANAAQQAAIAIAKKKAGKK
jgi:hypothetical protein